VLDQLEVVHRLTRCARQKEISVRLREHEVMPDLLSGVDVKLRRAAVHLDIIHAAALNFVNVELSRNQERHTTEEDPNDPSWMLLRWSKVPAIDPLLGAVLGDFVHNVRSALDQLMYSLVKLNGEEPGRHTFWPVFETQDQWRDNITKRKPKRGPAPAAGASEDAFRLVERWQPFQRGDGASVAPLLRLHNLWNVDKHRTLHAAVGVPSQVHDLPTVAPTGYLEITEAQAPVRPIPIQEGAVLLRFRTRELKPLPEGQQLRLTPPPIGVAVTFYAENEFIIGVEHLAPMLVDAREVYAGALELPEAGVAATT
jgi:hypothetical protein